MDLQTALGDPICTEVWVGQGAYVPVFPADPNSVSDAERAISFRIARDVELYGGFAGTEDARDERDPALNPTILSGDIDANDVSFDGNAVDETWTDIVGGNSYHVVYLDGTTDTPITASTLLDGFTITGGKAYGPNVSYASGGGLACYGEGDGHECSPILRYIRFSGNMSMDNGGAIYNDGSDGGASNPTLTNLSFRGNHSDSGAGGAITNNGWNGGISSPTLTNVVFAENSAIYGGAMHNHGPFGVSSPILTNVTFSGNTAAYSGGAMYNNNVGGVVMPILTNVTFIDNHSTDGGAIYNHDASPTLYDVTFRDNEAANCGGAVYNEDISSPKLHNVTFIGNSAVLGGAICRNLNNSDLTVSPTLSNVTFSMNRATDSEERFTTSRIWQSVARD